MAQEPLSPVEALRRGCHDSSHCARCLRLPGPITTNWVVFRQRDFVLFSLRLQDVTASLPALPLPSRLFSSTSRSILRTPGLGLGKLEKQRRCLLRVLELISSISEVTFTGPECKSMRVSWEAGKALFGPLHPWIRVFLTLDVYVYRRPPCDTWWPPFLPRHRSLPRKLSSGSSARNRPGFSPWKLPGAVS